MAFLAQRGFELMDCRTDVREQPHKERQRQDRVEGKVNFPTVRFWHNVTVAHCARGDDGPLRGRNAQFLASARFVPSQAGHSGRCLLSMMRKSCHVYSKNS